MDFKLYSPENYTYTSSVVASDFAFSFVSSSSAVNGALSTYSFSLTLSVKTSTNTIANITLPDELSFDMSQKIKCTGGQNLAGSLSCTVANDGKSF